jgi:hypothetical protein
MRRTVFLLTGIVASLCVSGALGADAERKPALQPAYIEMTNGLFSVCAFDRHDGVLIRYKGLSISRTNLPPASITRPVLIYALGNPPLRDGKAVGSWNPKSEDIYNYGDIPYPVRDIDPPLELCRTGRGDLLIGVRIRSRFYAITNAGEVAKTQLLGVAVHESSGNRLCVVTATQPMHREKEVSTLIQSLRSKE